MEEIDENRKIDIKKIHSIIEKLEEEEKKRKDLPFPLRTILNIKDFIWYKIILNIPNVPNILKWKVQRIIKGYSDYDIYNLNSFIFNKTYKPLKIFIKHYEEHGMSLPSEFASDPGTWLLILKKIEFAFDAHWADENDEENHFTKGMTSEQIEEHYKKVEEGFTLFGRHIRDLWD